MGLIDHVHFVMGSIASAVVEETLGVKAAVDLLLKDVGSGRWMQIEAKSGRQLLYHIITRGLQAPKMGTSPCLILWTEILSDW